MSSVIVFGPTGQVGSVAALTAAERGAHVWLAMRDTTKAIPGLTKDIEENGKFTRVQADLQQPETLAQAVKTSGAKRAFIYLLHGAPDHMKGIFEALKSAGIEFVVFLSSFTIDVDKELRDVAANEVIPYVHAQAEANLDDVFGSDHYVALRPGAFASNLLQYGKGILAGQVSLYGGVFEQDNIVPSDIGRVGGAILVSGPRNGQKKVYLYGPEVLSIHDSIVKMGKVLGKDVKVTALSPNEGKKNFLSSGMPEHFANYMVEALGTKGPDKGDGRFPRYDEGVQNVELYTGKPSTRFEDWIKESEGSFGQ